jgi:hypothetical protein
MFYSWSRYSVRCRMLNSREARKEKEMIEFALFILFVGLVICVKEDVL